MVSLDDLPTSGHEPNRGPALVAVLVATAAAVASFWPLLLDDTVIGLINVTVVVAFTATGIVLREESDQRATGNSLVLAAAFYLISWWWTWPPQWQVGPTALLSYVFGYLWFVLGVLALLRYPEPKLARWWDRWYVAALAFWVVVPKALLTVVSRPEWAGDGLASGAWWPTLWPDPHVFAVGSAVANVGLVVVGAPVLVPILLKVHRSRSVDRIEAVPGMAAAATVMVCGCAYMLARFLALPSATVDVLRAVIGVAALFTPIAFLSSALRRRMARGAVADMLVRLESAVTPQAIETELRRSLSDPTLTLWFWLPQQERYIGGEERMVDRPPVDGRFAVEIRSRASLLAVLVLDSALERHPQLVQPAVAACRFALENSRMQAELRSKLAELQGSATRLAQAELSGRRQIERDLHDGAQQTLMAVRMSLGQARHLVEPGSSAHEAIARAQGELRSATDELRQLAKGIAPPILTQSGLAAALDGVIERLGIAVDRTVLRDRLEPAVENTAYFVACEALTNAAKHAAASRTTLSITRNGGTVDIVVCDDGRGGARAGTGSGLVGLKDRAAAVGGTMTVESKPNTGTRIVVKLPCA